MANSDVRMKIEIPPTYVDVYIMRFSNKSRRGSQLLAVMSLRTNTCLMTWMPKLIRTLDDMIRHIAINILKDLNFVTDLTVDFIVDAR